MYVPGQGPSWAAQYGPTQFSPRVMGLSVQATLPSLGFWTGSLFSTPELRPSSTFSQDPQGAPNQPHLPYCHNDWPKSPIICVTSVKDFASSSSRSGKCPGSPAQHTKPTRRLVLGLGGFEPPGVCGTFLGYCGLTALRSHCLPVSHTVRSEWHLWPRPKLISSFPLSLATASGSRMGTQLAMTW